jgi:hypothetical protein
VTIQPADWRGSLRASHADREHVIETLKVAFVQGRLTKDEFDTRVAQTLAARTYADLSMLTVDIPAGLTGLLAPFTDLPARLAGFPAGQVQARPPVQPARRRTSSAASAGLSVTVALVVLVGLTAQAGEAGFYMCVAFCLLVLPVARAQFLYSREQSRSGGQSPPGGDTRQAGLGA